MSANYNADPFINSTQLCTIVLYFFSVEGVAIALAINMHLIIPLKTYSIYQKQHENKQASACQMDKRSTSTLAAQCTPLPPLYLYLCLSMNYSIKLA